MQNMLLVIQIILAVGLICVIVFLQRSAQDGGGLMGGGSTMGGLFTARGSANLITRTTAVLATLFILNSLALGYIASRTHQTHSALDDIAPVAPLTAPTAPVPPQPPAAPQVPAAH